MRAVVDTSVLIAGRPLVGVEAAMTVTSLVELHFGVLVADDADERARRTGRLPAVESAFDPLPVTVEVARRGDGWRLRSRAEVATRVVVRSTWRSRRRQSWRAFRC